MKVAVQIEDLPPWAQAQDALEGPVGGLHSRAHHEEKFDAALDAIMEEDGLAREEMLKQYSIGENYERDIDE